MIRNRLVVVVFAFIFLGGCSSTYSDKFACSSYPDMGCTPSEHVYNDTNGELDDYRKSRPRDHDGEDSDNGDNSGQSVNFGIKISSSK